MNPRWCRAMEDAGQTDDKRNGFFRSEPVAAVAPALHVNAFDIFADQEEVAFLLEGVNDANDLDVPPGGERGNLFKEGPFD